MRLALPLALALVAVAAHADSRIAALDAAMPPYGAVGEWRFLDGQQTSDESGFGPAGTLTNGAYVADGLLVLTNAAAPASMCIPDADYLTPSNAMTVAFWARPQIGDWTDWTAIGKEGSATDRAYYVRYSSSFNYGWAFVVSADGSTFSEHRTGSAFQFDNAWQHVACVFVGGASTKIYVNGADTGAALTAGSQQSHIKNNDAPLCLGRRRDGAECGKYRGHLARVYLFPRAISPDEIQRLYLEGPPQ